MSDDLPHDEAISGPLWRRVLSYTGYLVLWLVYTVVSFWLIFQLEEVVVTGAMLLRLNPWQVRALDKFSVVLWGLAWLIGMLLVEAYLRNGVAKKQLVRRAVKVYLGLIIFTVAVAGVNLLI
jgi:hypothetical protein